MFFERQAYRRESGIPFLYGGEDVKEGVGLRSEPMRAALEDYLVKGIDKAAAAALNGVRLPNLERDLGKLDTFADLIARIHDHDSESHKK